MATKKKKGKHISKFLKSADKTIERGIRRADEALDEAIDLAQKAAVETERQKKILSKKALKTTKELSKKARDESEKIRASSAKTISSGIASARQLATRRENLAILERLDELRKAGIITKMEFIQKKKQILARI